MSQLDVVLAGAVPTIDAAVRAYGAGVLSKVQDGAVDATVGLGRRILQLIWRHTSQPAALEAAVTDLAAAPGDADALAALRLQLRKLLAGDPQLVSQLAAILPTQGAVTASGERSVAIGGDMSVNAPDGIAGGVIHGSAVVVNPQPLGPGVG